MTQQQRVELASKALTNGVTRGRFIRENSTSRVIAELQLWSDAYSEAMRCAS
jgi:hypothetical protein